MSSGVLVRILTKDKNILNLVADQVLASPFIIAKSCLTGLKTVNKVALRGKKELETNSKPKNKNHNGTESVLSGKLTLIGRTQNKGPLGRVVSQLSHLKHAVLIEINHKNVRKVEIHVILKKVVNRIFLVLLRQRYTLEKAGRSEIKLKERGHSESRPTKLSQRHYKSKQNRRRAASQQLRLLRVIKRQIQDELSLTRPGKRVHKHRNYVSKKSNFRPANANRLGEKLRKRVRKHKNYVSWPTLSQPHQADRLGEKLRKKASKPRQK